jgi:hypothetical protein
MRADVETLTGGDVLAEEVMDTGLDAKAGAEVQAGVYEWRAGLQAVCRQRIQWARILRPAFAGRFQRVEVGDLRNKLPVYLFLSGLFAPGGYSIEQFSRP